MKKGFTASPVTFSNNKLAQNKVGGFTILETLVAALLLALALTGVAGLVQSSFQIARDYKDSITAAMLAQEGMEMVREQRDKNIATTGTSTRWLEGLVKPPTGSFICDHSTQECIAKLQNDGTVVFERCLGDSDDCPFLRFDTSRGVFNHNSGTITHFKRSIHVTRIGQAEAEVRVRIEWPGLVTTKSLLLETHLFQWQL